MPERMRFLPKAEILTLEEIARLARAFVRLGLKKLRVTGGEPLVRKGVMELMAALAALRAEGLEELTLTTNGLALAQHAEALAGLGVKRVNVSLDSLDRESFARIARRDALPEVLEGIAAAQAAGLHVKLNTVALAQDNARELPHLIEWGHARGMDVCLIEVMPMGEVEADRADQFLSLAAVRRDLERRWRLEDLPDRTGGPARYVRVAETGGRLGFITPLSHTFCESCNRVRLSAVGRLYLCLGQSDSADLRAPLRAGADDAALEAAIREAIAAKPKGHDFRIARAAPPAQARHMSLTGG